MSHIIAKITIDNLVTSILTKQRKLEEEKQDLNFFRKIPRVIKKKPDSMVLMDELCAKLTELQNQAGALDDENKPELEAIYYAMLSLIGNQYGAITQSKKSLGAAIKQILITELREEINESYVIECSSKIEAKIQRPLTADEYKKIQTRDFDGLINLLGDTNWSLDNYDVVEAISIYKDSEVAEVSIEFMRNIIERNIIELQLKQRNSGKQEVVDVISSNYQPVPQRPGANDAIIQPVDLAPESDAHQLRNLDKEEEEEGARPTHYMPVPVENTAALQPSNYGSAQAVRPELLEEVLSGRRGTVVADIRTDALLKLFDNTSRQKAGGNFGDVNTLRFNAARSIDPATHVDPLILDQIKQLCDSYDKLKFKSPKPGEKIDKELEINKRLNPFNENYVSGIGVKNIPVPDKGITDGLFMRKITPDGINSLDAEKLFRYLASRNIKHLDIRIVQFLSSAERSLRAINEADVIHGDLALRNVLIKCNDPLQLAGVICDFGNAWLLGERIKDGKHPLRTLTAAFIQGEPASFTDGWYQFRMLFIELMLIVLRINPADVFYRGIELTEEELKKEEQKPAEKRRQPADLLLQKFAAQIRVLVGKTRNNSIVFDKIMYNLAQCLREDPRFADPEYDVLKALLVMMEQYICTKEVEAECQKNTGKPFKEVEILLQEKEHALQLNTYYEFFVKTVQKQLQPEMPHDAGARHELKQVLQMLLKIEMPASFTGIPGKPNNNYQQLVNYAISPDEISPYGYQKIKLIIEELYLALEEKKTAVAEQQQQAKLIPFKSAFFPPVPVSSNTMEPPERPQARNAPTLNYGAMTG